MLSKVCLIREVDGSVVQVHDDVIMISSELEQYYTIYNNDLAFEPAMVL